MITNLVSTQDLALSQLQKAADSIHGLNVGVVNSSVEEWRMRSRGANVSV